MYARQIYYELLTAAGIVLRSRPLCGPRIAQINISDNCNLHCVICNRKAMGVCGLLSAESIRRLLDELHRMGCREIFYHGFGEPAMHPDLPAIMRHTREKYPQFRQHIISNGSWNSSELLKEILRNNIKVRFSVHGGDRETWSRIHPDDDPALFDQTVDNLLQLSPQRPGKVEMLFVICNLNWNVIEPMLELARRCQVRDLIFRPMRLFPDRYGNIMNGHLMLAEAEFIAVKERLLRVRDSHEFNIQMAPFYENLYSSDLQRPSSRDYYLQHNCLIGYVLTVIERDGSVWGCVPEATGGISLGNIHQKNFAAIWYSPEYRQFREKQLFHNKQCLDQEGCHSYCQHLDKNRKLNNLKRLRLADLLRNYRNR